MLRDGLYQVAYFTIGQSPRECDHILASVRDGKILGSDRHGGIYLGGANSGASHDATGLVQLICEIPPGGELVTGLAAGPDGVTISASGVFDPVAAKQKIIVELAGKQLEIEISYLGPLPA